MTHVAPKIDSHSYAVLFYAIMSDSFSQAPGGEWEQTGGPVQNRWTHTFDEIEEQYADYMEKGNPHRVFKISNDEVENTLHQYRNHRIVRVTETVVTTYEEIG